jgi:DNA ligase D-like protein (predicted 3'-phosphoesterase)
LGLPTGERSGTLPGEHSANEGRRPAFVLHEHQRPQHHFDLRLEEGGVLRSWALPKGLPEAPSRNRLAVEVDDHELAHLTYVDADKSIADIGWWEEHSRNDRRIVFTLHGRSGSVRYALIHTSSDWLMHRMKDQGERA